MCCGNKQYAKFIVHFSNLYKILHVFLELCLYGRSPSLDEDFFYLSHALRYSRTGESCSCSRFFAQSLPLLMIHLWKSAAYFRAKLEPQGAEKHVLAWAVHRLGVGVPEYARR